MHFCTFSSAGYNSKQATCKLLPQGPFPSLCIRAPLLSPPPSPLLQLPLWCSCFCFEFSCMPAPDPFPWLHALGDETNKVQRWWQAVLEFYSADTLLTHRQQSSSTATLQLSSSGFSNKWKCFLKKYRLSVEAGCKNLCYCIHVINIDFHHSELEETVSET